MTYHGLQFDLAKISQFARVNGIAQLSLFGSILREDFSKESDVDVLVEFQTGRRITFFDMARLEGELTSIIGRKVDLRTPRELSRFFRDEVVGSAEKLYAA